MRSEMVIVLFLAAGLSLRLHYLHENRENNRIISVGGLEEGWYGAGVLEPGTRLAILAGGFFRR